MPVTENDFEVSIPKQDVPARPGEPQALLNLEDTRRKASLVSELQATLARLNGSAVGEAISRASGGKSGKARAMQIRRKRDDLKKSTIFRDGRWEGPCAPFTVINLNPVDLKLVAELQRWTIPAAGAGKPVNLKFKGRAFIGSFMTLTEPHVYLRITGYESDNLARADVATHEAKAIAPIGLAHQFYSHYIRGARGMGGIIAFEGDIHTLEKLNKQRTTIWVPQAEPLSEDGEVYYTVEEKPYLEVLESALTMQRRYAEMVIAEGHSYATAQADEIKNQLTSYHILWHNWAIDRGYKKEPERWAAETLQDSPNVEAIYCPDCHQRQDNPQQYFCKNCNTPFDAFKAFMAGKVVSPDRLSIYPVDSKEFQTILAETRRRKANIAMLELDGDEEKKGKKKEKEPEAK